MTPPTRCAWILLLALPLPLFLPADSPHPLIGQYYTAVEQTRQAHQERLDNLLEMYTNHLDRLIAEAQPRGDIESIVLYLDEKENPGGGDPPEKLASVRRSLTEQQARLRQRLDENLLRIEEQFVDALERRIREYTRDDEMEKAVSLNAALREARERIADLRPPEEPQEPEEPPLRLGDNIFPQGHIREDNQDRWSFTAPGGRNRTGFHSESRAETGTGARNHVLRFQQDEHRALGAYHPLNLDPSQEYHLSWRTRLQRPWRDGIELRGKGTMFLGIQISSARFNTLPELEQARLRRTVGQRVGHRVSLPDSTDEWSRHSRVIPAAPHMNQLLIRVSTGEGDFLIDDIELRPLLPPEDPRE